MNNFTVQILQFCLLCYCVLYKSHLVEVKYLLWLLKTIQFEWQKTMTESDGWPVSNMNSDWCVDDGFVWVLCSVAVKQCCVSFRGYLRSFHAFSAVGYGKRGVWKTRERQKRPLLPFNISFKYVHYVYVCFEYVCMIITVERSVSFQNYSNTGAHDCRWIHCFQWYISFSSRNQSPHTSYLQWAKCLFGIHDKLTLIQDVYVKGL